MWNSIHSSATTIVDWFNRLDHPVHRDRTRLWLPNLRNLYRALDDSIPYYRNEKKDPAGTLQQGG